MKLAILERDSYRHCSRSTKNSSIREESIHVLHPLKQEQLSQLLVLKNFLC